VKKRILILPFRTNRIHLLSVGSLADIFLRILKTGRLHNRVFIAADEGPVLLSDLVNQIHSFYYNRAYPFFLRIPNLFFAVFEEFLHAGHHSQWLGRVQRISRDWYFDTHDANTLIGFQPANTQKEFLKYLHSLK